MALTAHILEGMFEQQIEGISDVISIAPNPATSAEEAPFAKRAKRQRKPACKVKAKKVPESKPMTEVRGEGATLDLPAAESTNDTQELPTENDLHTRESAQGIAPKSGAVSPQPGDKRQCPSSPLGAALDKTAKRTRIAYSGCAKLAEQTGGTSLTSSGKGKAPATAFACGNVEGDGMTVDDSFEAPAPTTVLHPHHEKKPSSLPLPQANSHPRSSPIPEDDAVRGGEQTYADDGVAFISWDKSDEDEDDLDAIRRLTTSPSRASSSNTKVDLWEPPTRPRMKNPFAPTQHGGSAHRSANTAYSLPRRPTNIALTARGLSPFDREHPRNPIAPANPGSLANTRVGAARGSHRGKAR